MLAPVMSAVRRLSRAALALCAALLLLVSALGAGRTYLWCAMMERAVEACCCDPAREGDEGPAGTEIHAACCEDRAVAEADKARVAAGAIELPAAVLVGIVGPQSISSRASSPIVAPRLPTARAPQNPIRAGPLRAADIAVRLQVFRC